METKVHYNEAVENVMNVLYEQDEFYAMFNFVKASYIDSVMTLEDTKTYLLDIYSGIEDKDNFLYVMQELVEFTENYGIKLDSLEFKCQQFAIRTGLNLNDIKNMSTDPTLGHHCDELMYQINEFVDEVREYLM